MKADLQNRSVRCRRRYLPDHILVSTSTPLIGHLPSERVYGDDARPTTMRSTLLADYIALVFKEDVSDILAVTLRGKLAKMMAHCMRS